MPKFRAGGEDEYPERVPAEEATYRLAIDEYQIVSLDPDKWNKTPREQIRFLLTFEAYADDEDAQIVDADGQPLDEDRKVMFFFEPTKMGLKPRVSNSRRFLASALGVDVAQPVEYESYEELAEDLLGREIIADVIVKKTERGRINKIESTRALRKKATRTRVPKASLAEEAEKVFAEDVESSEEVDSGDY